MTTYEREIFIDVEPPQRAYRYAVTLEALERGAWDTVRLWDNADAPDEHHEPEYSRSGGKQSPEILGFASENEATVAAIRRAASGWPTMIAHWRST